MAMIFLAVLAAACVLYIAVSAEERHMEQVSRPHRD